MLIVAGILVSPNKTIEGTLTVWESGACTRRIKGPDVPVCTGPLCGALGDKMGILVAPLVLGDAVGTGVPFLGDVVPPLLPVEPPVFCGCVGGLSYITVNGAASA